MDMIIILAAITAFVSLGLLVSDVRLNEKETTNNEQSNYYRS